MNEGQVVTGGFIAACGNSPVMFNVTQESSYFITTLLEVSIYASPAWQMELCDCLWRAGSRRLTIILKMSYDYRSQSRGSFLVLMPLFQA